jgi:hypothetical protein
MGKVRVNEDLQGVIDPVGSHAASADTPAVEPKSPDTLCKQTAMEWARRTLVQNPSPLTRHEWVYMHRWWRLNAITADDPGGSKARSSGEEQGVQPPAND